MKIDTPDGRTLQIHEAGDPDGELVLFHHGTPGNGLMLPAWDEHAAASGIRLVAHDRPGYGGSDRRPGRAVADVAPDAAAIADALGAARFATFGASGGGPHALACGALLPDRVAAVAIVASVAPFDAEGLNFFAGMGRDNWVEFGSTLAGAHVVEPLLDEEAKGLAAAAPTDVMEGLQSLVSPPDQAVLDGGLAGYLHATITQGTAPGVGGWVDDDVAFVEPWGFDLRAMEAPVLVVHGCQDRFVPVAHGEWLVAALPDAERRIDEDEGHLSLVANGIPAVLDWLRERLV